MRRAKNVTLTLTLTEKALYDLLHPSHRRAQRQVQYVKGLPKRIMTTTSTDCNKDTSQYEPTAQDVLCGRGAGTNAHEGNKRFRAAVAEHQQDYHAAKKMDKTVIARQIVKMIESNGGRFLQKNSTTGLWEAVTDKRAMEKTKQALREWNVDVRGAAIQRALDNALSSADNK